MGRSWVWPWSRRKSRVKVGIVLGGGAVRGAAHLGVLSVLEAAGIRPDFVVGVSAGALVGALYCAGVPLAQLEVLARELNWGDLLRFHRPRLGLFDTRPLGEELLKLTGVRRIEELSLPFAAVAVDVLDGELVVLREGPLDAAVRASCAIPGLFDPVEWDGRLLVDGGVRNNLPVSVAREAGAEYVIAVGLNPPITTRHRPRTLMEIWYQSFNILLQSTGDEGALADCLITPNVAHLSLSDFSQVPELIDRGREAAEAALPRILADLQR